jgi:5-formyltetrahydrofolate cyclo-ligase
MLKKELRKKYKELRKTLSVNEIDELSINIANNTLTLPIWDKDTFHVFLPIERLNEVNTEFIMHVLQGKDKNIAISKSNFETNQMTHYLLTDNTNLNTNEYGIPEPVSGIPVNTENIDVVFVPLLAFDAKGNRVGYGKGFYDTFLNQCKTNTIKIGLSFFDEEPEVIDTYEHDIKLNYCITPNKIYKY